MGRNRPALSIVLSVLVAVCVTIATLSLWANSTLFDSASFSERAVGVLDSSQVRKELASRLTEELARAGNQQAINFRPAFQFAVEVAADTDTFRAIFRNAVRRTHEALLQGRGSGAGIDLSDSLTIISSTMQLPGSAAPSPEGVDSSGSGGLSTAFDDITRTIGDLWIWGAEDLTASIFLGSLLAAVVLAALAIFVSGDRRQAVVRLGLALVLAGVLILLLRLAAELAVRRVVGDPELGAALAAAVSSATEDLRVAGLWIPAYGVIIAAAAATTVYSPRWAWERVQGWVERRRASTGGTVGLAVLLLVAGVAVTLAPGFWLTLGAQVVGLWLAYYGVVLLLGLIQRVPAGVPAEARPGREHRRLALAGLVVLVLIAGVTASLLFVTRQAASSARAAGAPRCLGDDELCDVPLNEVVFPGSHNSMSSALYPGWLFAEQIGTIKGQLESGVRAFLIDTHYGVPSTVRMPGANTRLVLTDRAAELSAPPGEEIDPSVAERAQALAARASRAANAQRSIYLCHNFCELGAVAFSEVLADFKQFLDTNPDEVLLLIIQDATTPADTAAAIERAGLAEQAYTLRKGEPLPTLRQMIEADQRLLVFAEEGGPGAPEWYMKAYDWFQETGYSFDSIDAFDCRPNRGDPANPLFLLNHWVSASPPNPSRAQAANRRNVLEGRIFRCLSERGRMPNVIALDFVERGDGLSTVDELSTTLREAYRNLAAERAEPVTTVPGPSTIGPGLSSTTTAFAGTVPPLPEFTQVTTLTGGDPALFCEAVPSAKRVFDSWVVAVVSAVPDDQGRADLVYAPLLSREVERLYAAAPQELVELSAALRERIDLALAELGRLGVSEAALGVQATTVARALDEGQDALSIELAVLEQLEQEHGVDEVATAVGRLATALQGDLAAIDLGEVDPDVAEAAGFTCLA